MHFHILLIGIKPKMGAFLERHLHRQGYRVSQVSHDRATPLRVQQLRPDLILMNLLTEDNPDLAPCRQLSSAMKKVPIILLGRDNIQDRVASLSVCAIDYLSVPFSIEEFLARVRSRLRRIRWEKREEIFEVAELRLDTQTYEVQRDGQLIELTAKEFDLLKYLMAHPGRIMTHQQIFSAVWPDSPIRKDINLLHVYIRYLRQKLKSAGSLIQTVRGIGYTLKDEH